MNQKGFSSVGLLILFPLLLTALAVAAGAYFIFQSDGVAKHACRVELLEAQAKAAAKLNALIKLNPQATSLRRQMKVINLAIRAAAGNAPLLAALNLKKAHIYAQQLVLSGEQKLLISSGKLHSFAGPQRANAKLRRELGKRIYSGAAQSYSDKQGSFNVIARPAGALTPDYEPAQNFSRTQEMKLTWSYQAEIMLPKWVRPFIGKNSVRLNANCSTTLEKENGEWVPKIKMARF